MICSGFPIPNFKSGWSFIAFSGHKTHYYIEQDWMEPEIVDGEPLGYYKSLCGFLAITHPKKKPALGAGDLPKCKRCLSMAKKEGVL